MDVILYWISAKRSVQFIPYRNANSVTRPVDGCIIMIFINAIIIPLEQWQPMENDIRHKEYFKFKYPNLFYASFQF